jgi:predicted nucleotidyltransferase
LLYLSDILQTLKAKQHELSSIYHLSSIGVFGSYADNKQTDDSDIDFIVEFDADALDIFDLKYGLREYLKSLFNKDIDLANKRYLKPYIRQAILETTKYAV